MPVTKKKKTRKSPERKPLSRDRILRAALALADKQGLEALSMRNLAAELSVEAMSLYKHVANKDDMLDGLVEIILREMEMPAADTPWREAMRRRAWSKRRTIQRHPWASYLLESRTAPSEARLSYADNVLSFLKTAGFPPEVQYRAFLTIDSYVYGFVQHEVNWPTQDSDRETTITGVKDYLKDGRFSTLMTVVQHVASMKPAPGAQPYDVEFEFGLELILDALERRLSESANP